MRCNDAGPSARRHLRSKYAQMNSPANVYARTMLSLAFLLAACSGAGGGGSGSGDAGPSTWLDASPPSDSGLGETTSGAPEITSLSIAGALDDSTKSVTVVADVWDPQGLADISGGKIYFGPTLLGAMEQKGPGTYSFELSWLMLNNAELIKIAPSATIQRKLSIAFSDVAGHTTYKEHVLQLSCAAAGEALGACGSCQAYQPGETVKSFADCVTRVCVAPGQNCRQACEAQGLACLSTLKCWSQDCANTYCKFDPPQAALPTVRVGGSMRVHMTALRHH